MGGERLESGEGNASNRGVTRKYFTEKKSKALKLPSIPKLGPGAIDKLMEYNWPGNVREMENIVERALIVNPTDPLTFNNIGLSPEIKKAESRYETGKHLPTYDEMVSGYIQQTLKATNGKIHGPGGAADLMGINPNTLRSKMKKLGINYKRKSFK